MPTGLRRLQQLHSCILEHCHVAPCLHDEYWQGPPRCALYVRRELLQAEVNVADLVSGPFECCAIRVRLNGADATVACIYSRPETGKVVKTLQEILNKVESKPEEPVIACTKIDIGGGMLTDNSILDQLSPACDSGRGPGKFAKALLHQSLLTVSSAASHPLGGGKSCLRGETVQKESLDTVGVEDVRGTGKELWGHASVIGFVNVTADASSAPRQNQSSRKNQSDQILQVISAVISANLNATHEP
ncbi:uncharacterized protein [Dermacentor andersoni]|uniref:uncharacterized protein n=1 Tax=Dermacentor andersoni TaxID=34620 RepID=UPI003B3BDA95